MMSGYELILM